MEKLVLEIARYIGDLSVMIVGRLFTSKVSDCELCHLDVVWEYPGRSEDEPLSFLNRAGYRELNVTDS